MGTHKICAALNNGAPHQNAHCDRLWGAVCGCFANAKVSAHRDHLDGVEAQFGGSIFVQDKAVAPPRITPARRADREDGETATFTRSGSVFGRLAWLRFWASAPKLAPCLREIPLLSRFRWLRNGSFETRYHQNILYGG